jgi:PAS domain-containing protein
VNKQLSRGQGLSFTDSDGTRLAIAGTPTRGTRIYNAQQLLDLPGTTLVLRMDSWRGTPDFFPNVLTALVSAMAMALIAVLLLLGRDMRRRLKAENDLAEALAFRKAMEDSLVTGLRARDLQGRITYVNPAFCITFPARIGRRSLRGHTKTDKRFGWPAPTCHAAVMNPSSCGATARAFRCSSSKHLSSMPPENTQVG